MIKNDIHSELVKVRCALLEMEKMKTKPGCPAVKSLEKRMRKLYEKLQVLRLRYALSLLG